VIAVAAVGYGLAAFLFTVLTVLLLTQWRGRPRVGICSGRRRYRRFGRASTRTRSWTRSSALPAFGRRGAPHLLLAVLPPRHPGPIAERSVAYRRMVLGGRILLLALVAIVLLTPGGVSRSARRWSLPRRPAISASSPSCCVAIAGMALVEQVLRNTPAERRWTIKYLCIGLGAIFVFDFYLYTDALLFRRVDREIWLARGVVNAMVVPLIASRCGPQSRLVVAAGSCRGAQCCTRRHSSAPACTCC